MADPVATQTQVTTGTPLWYDQLAQQFGNQVGGALTMAGNLGQNWYDQPLTADVTSLQQNALQGAGTAAGAWTPYAQTGWSTMQQAAPQYQAMGTTAGQIGGLGQFNQAGLQQQLNPYVGGVVDEIGRLGMERFTEDMLPQVNQTFTGAGQFGGTRNAEFINRALRDTQREISGAQGQALKGAYDSAAQNYLGWDTARRGALTGAGQMYQGAGAGLANLGTGMGGFGTNVAGQTWQDLTQQYGMGAQAQATEQQALDRAYQDWASSVSTPVNLTGALSQMMTQFPSLYRGAQTQVVAPQAAPSSDLTTLLAILAGASG